jgi:RpiR family carbohydrate utilization transcriptional regulator
MMQDVLASIRDREASLSPAEAKVARAVLAAPEQAIHASISRLARAAGVSEPTVNRFCRSVGHDGYAAFRIALAQGLGRGTPFVNANVEPDDPPELYARKIFEAGADALRRAALQLDGAAVARAVQALAGARQILVFGVGGSGPVASDAVHKFARLGVPSTAHVDPIMQRMVALATSPGDVLLAISGSGRTRLVVENARLAVQAGATVIAVTCPGSPLGAIATIVLGLEPAEDNEVYTPMGSRLAHLAMIDALMTGVVLARGPGFAAQLGRIKSALNETRLPEAARQPPRSARAREA